MTAPTPDLPKLAPRGFRRISDGEYLHDTFFMGAVSPSIATTLVSLEDAHAAILADRAAGRALEAVPMGYVCERVALVKLLDEIDGLSLHAHKRVVVRTWINGAIARVEAEGRRAVELADFAARDLAASPAASPVPEIGMRDATYADSTPLLHVGRSAFEDWFQAQPFACTPGIKQISRDSYAAGMGDPLVTYAAASPVPEALETEVDAWEHFVLNFRQRSIAWKEKARWFIGRYFGVEIKCPELMNRAIDLNEKARMPWSQACELALSEVGFDETDLDELIGECSPSVMLTLLPREDVEAYTRAVLVFGASQLNLKSEDTLSSRAVSAFDDLKRRHLEVLATPQPSADMVPCDPVDAEIWKELYRLREAVKGPKGFATWQDAAVDERLRRVKAEAALATTALPAAPTETVLDALRELLWCARSQIPAAVLGSDAQNAWSDRCAAAHNKAAALLEGVQPTEHPDTKRLDWLERQRVAYGFADVHEGNNWLVEGPYRTAREAIDAALAQPSQPAETGERKAP